MLECPLKLLPCASEPFASEPFAKLLTHSLIYYIVLLTMFRFSLFPEIIFPLIVTICLFNCLNFKFQFKYVKLERSYLIVSFFKQSRMKKLSLAES